MPKESMLESLVDELKTLRKNEGFSHNRAMGHIGLQKSLGDRSQLCSVTEFRFLTAIKSIDSPRIVKCLLAAYGLDDDYRMLSTLSERREKYSLTVNRKCDTIKEWEDLGIKALAKALLDISEMNLPFSIFFMKKPEKEISAYIILKRQ